jgi:hypothetical protein
VYGPEGLEQMTTHVLEAWRQDIETRTKGLERKPPLVIHAHDVNPGVVYKDDKVTVTAFQVAHGEWAHAFGYARSCGQPDHPAKHSSTARSATTSTVPVTRRVPLESWISIDPTAGGQDA